MPIDRQLQRDMLIKMRDAYPSSVRFRDLEGDEDQKIKNLLYLADHGLCEAGVHQGLNGQHSVSVSKINARGLDFLEDDGGLTAILQTVTVRLHADSIRDLMIAKVDSTSAPLAERSKIKKHLANLSGAALEAATTDLVGQGLAHIPDVLSWLRGLGLA